MLDALIIGGGITGLVAAYRLAGAGKHFMLLEPGQLGGLIRTDRIDGFVCERGPNVLVEKEALAKLLNDLSLGAERVAPSVERYAQSIWHDGKVVDAPRTLWRAVGSPLFGIPAKALMPLRALKPGTLRPRAEDESVAVFFSRVIGAEAVRNMFQPILQGIYGGDVMRLSARAVFPELWRHASEGRSLFSFARGRKKARVFVLRGGMDSLTRALADRLPADARAADAVRQVSYDAGEKKFQVAAESGRIFDSRALLVTTSGAASAAFLRGFSPDAAERLERLRYAPLVSAHAAVSGADAARIRRDAFGVLFPPGTAGTLLGVMFNSALFPHVAPRGTHLLTLCLGGVNAPHILNAPDEAIQAEIGEELRAKLGVERPRILALQRWPRAVVQLEVGHHKTVEAMREAERRFPGLIFCGTDAGGIGIPDRVQAAESAAARILAGDNAA
jgi:oxygen-dependent protoporphyrinogen oxidase